MSVFHVLPQRRLCAIWLMSFIICDTTASKCKIWHDIHMSFWQYLSLCLNISHYLSLCLPMSPYVSLSLNISHYLSLRLPMSHYASLCLNMSHYLSLCLPMSPYASLSLNISPYVSLRLPMSHYASLCLNMSNYLSLCLPTSHYVSLCLPISPYLSLCLISLTMTWDTVCLETWRSPRHSHVPSHTMSRNMSATHSTRGGGLGSRPNKMYGERLGDGVQYHLMSPTPRR